MDQTQPTQTLAARYAKWLVREQPCGSPKARKILAWILFLAGIIGLVISALTMSERMYYLGGFMILLGIHCFQLAGFSELIDQKNNSNHH